MITLLALAVSLLIVVANVAVAAIFMVRWERRVDQPVADPHDRALPPQDAETASALHR